MCPRCKLEAHLMPECLFKFYESECQPAAMTSLIYQISEGRSSHTNMTEHEVAEHSQTITHTKTICEHSTE